MSIVSIKGFSLIRCILGSIATGVPGQPTADRVAFRRRSILFCRDPTLLLFLKCDIEDSNIPVQFEITSLANDKNFGSY